MAAPTVGLGTILTFGTNSAPGALVSFSHSGVSRPAVDSSNMQTTDSRAFIPAKLIDYGTFVFRFQMDGADWDTFKTLIGSAAESLTIDVAGDSTGNIVACATCFLTDMQADVEIDDIIEGTFTFKLAATITVS